MPGAGENEGGESAISTYNTGNSENLEVVQDDSHVAEIDMAIGNRIAVLEEPQIGESAISSLGGFGRRDILWWRNAGFFVK